MVTYLFIQVYNAINANMARLVAQDRHEEARQVISQYHANGDNSHPLVAFQMKEMAASLETVNMSWKEYFNLRVLFETRASRYRMMLNITFSWFGQFSGNKYEHSLIHH